ncbi:PREDICTED: uncharacterized protein LOC107355211 isoform X2 [Acropora digitifera]|uniref:uncharacterized protein LOC107355211 isoform X2 n=1 Tax=Acropora digitifera TaxID=70779 RepID=UPI00077AA62F|nr:PREDICTED: uncharacterized protein LOC107355211 isoform X2 [Acropora digitifera]
MVSKLCCGFKKLLESSHSSNFDEGYPRREEYANPVQCTEEHDLEQEVTVPITRQPTKAPIQCTEPEALTGSDFQCKVSVELSVAAAGDKEVKVNAKVRFPGTRNGVERLGKKQN